MLWFAAVQAAETLARIPATGLIQVSPRLAAGSSAAVAAGLLLLMWSYRQRRFILIWSAAWACVAASLFLVSGDNADSVVTTARLSLAATAAVASVELFYAGLLSHRGVLRWRSLLIVLAVTTVGFTVLPGLLPVNVLLAVVFAALAGWNVVTAAESVRIGHQRQMVGAFIMAVALGIVVLCNASAAIAALTLAVNLTAVGVVLLTNAICFLLIAFGGLLFVFEDMLLELRDSNRELLAARAELHHAAMTDSLTMLYNRRLFDEVAAHQLEHHKRFNLPLSLIYIDIDRFKAVNDTLGHDVGDQLLKHVAGYLRSQVREADYVFRMGGDEFLVLISCSGLEATRKAEDLRAAFVPTLREAGLPDSVDLSIGITELPPGGRDIAAAVQQADERMYADKRRRSPGSGEMIAPAPAAVVGDGFETVPKIS